MTNPAERVATDLIEAGLLDRSRAGEATSVISRSLGTASAPLPVSGSARSGLVEIAGYVGGALVVAALGLFVAEEWSSLSEAMQVMTLLVIAVLLAGAGLAVLRIGGGAAELRREGDDVRRRLTSALLTAGAGAAALAGGVQADLLDGDDFTSWPELAGGVTLLALAAFAYLVAPSALGQLVMAGAALTSIFNGLSLVGDESSSTLVPGLCILVLAGAWVALAERGLFGELMFARAIAAALALFGAQLPLFDGNRNSVAYALTAIVAAAGFVLYLRTVSWPYLVAGVVGVTLVVPEAIIDWTEGSLGVAGAVLVAGVTLLAASVAGLRLRKEVTED